MGPTLQQDYRGEGVATCHLLAQLTVRESSSQARSFPRGGILSVKLQLLEESSQYQVGETCICVDLSLFQHVEVSVMVWCAQQHVSTKRRGRYRPMFTQVNETNTCVKVLISCGTAQSGGDAALKPLHFS